MQTNDPVIKEYLRFMIANKEITGKSWQNRKANKFYQYLRNNANMYNVPVYKVLERDAYFVINGILIKLNN